MSYKEYCKIYAVTYPVREILCGENPTKTFFAVHDEYAVCSLCSTKLTGICDGNVISDSERLTGLQRSYSAFCSYGLSTFVTLNVGS